MKFARTALVAVALVLLAQGAFAIKKDKTPEPPKTPSPNIVYVPVGKPSAPTPTTTYLPKLSYCFVNKTGKPTIDAQCPPGYKLDKPKNSCVRDNGFSCPEGGLLTIDSFGAAVCKYCKAGYKLGADNKCTMDCKKGFKVTTISGVKYCVEDCKEGYTAQGNDCISTKKVYTPKSCSDKLCLPKFKLYFTKTTTSGRKLSNAKPSCVCALTDTRNVYEQPCVDPSYRAATKSSSTFPPVCPDGAMPVAGVCTLACPKSCTETLDGRCEYPCPAGSVPCKTLLFAKVCVKGSATYAHGQSVCDAVKKMKMDKSLVCPIPKPAPVPSPVFKPKAAPSPKHKPSIKDILDKLPLGKH